MNTAILRIIDVNANRAREALRVLEDYARFSLDDDSLCRRLKQLRHDLTEALEQWLPQAILHRNTPNDVGTTIKTSRESTRQDASHVLIAAGKRLGEALRSLEEFAKTESPAKAASIESIRYRFYDIEQTLAFTLHPKNRFQGVQLYVLITSSLCKRPWLQTARESIAGGADCLQLREKDLDSGELLARAKTLVALCRKHHVISIINDRADIALLSNADGVHLGQTDLPPRDARRILGPQKIIGVSTHSLPQAKQALRDGADYIGVGPIFPSTTKSRPFLPGLTYARQVAQKIKIPAVAISGITPKNVDDVLATGLRAVAITAAIVSSKTPRQTTQQIKKKLVAKTKP